MDLRLSWDLFIVVFFVIIAAYSLIIGRDNTIKVILGTYVALVCADAIGGLVSHYFLGTEVFVAMMKEAQFDGAGETIIFLKVLIFVLMVILFAVKGSFDVMLPRQRGPVGLVLHLFYASCSAGLIVSTILIFVSGVSIIDGGGVVKEALNGITKESYLVESVVYYYNFWFAVPAVAFLLNSLVSGGEEE